MAHSPVSLATAEDVVLAAPLMLGYWPDASICAIFVDDDDEVVVIMRWDSDAEMQMPHVEHLSPEDRRIRTVHIVVFPARGDMDVAPWLRAADLLVASGARPGHFLLAGAAEDGVAWTHALALGEDATVGHIAEADVLSRARRWGLPRWQAHREEYVGDITPQPERARRIEIALEAVAPVTEAERDAAIALVRDALHGDDVLSDDECARVGVALTDVQVRDTVLWDVMHEAPGAWGAIADRLAVAVAALPQTHVASPATLLAILRWQTGDGSRASAAVGRALESDPAYTLAILVERCLSRGMHPAAWREGLVTLRRSACRRAAA